MVDSSEIREGLRDGIVSVVRMDDVSSRIWKKCRRMREELSARQLQVAYLRLVKGLTLQAIAYRLGIAKGSVTNHWIRLLRKIDL